MSQLRYDAATRRAQILDAALREIGEKGYRGFTIQGLAGRCALTNAGLLHYFGSKDKLLVALLDEMGLREELAIEPLLALAADDASSSSMSYAAMVSVLRTLAERVELVPELARFAAVLHTESLEQSHPAHHWFANREREALELFARLTNAWSSDPAQSARLLWAMLHGLIHHWLRNPSVRLVHDWEKAIRILVPSPDRAQSN